MLDSFFYPLINTNNVQAPSEFTFPFYYVPHELALTACSELQYFLEQNQKSWNHNFGLSPNKKLLSVGKMFGILVVENEFNEIGYLRAHSGELIDTSLAGFVPPIFSDKADSSLVDEVDDMSSNIKQLSIDLKDLTKELKSIESRNYQLLKKQRVHMKSLKLIRDEKRKSISSPDDLRSLELESIEQKKILKSLKESLNIALDPLQLKQAALTEQINLLNTTRKNLLNKYQDEKYGNVYLSNYSGRKKSLREIFSNSPREKIPMGSGHCAAPKLLQFAYQNKFKPLALAEFWWGESPIAEVRTHKNIYPACNSRCKPILTFMLEGLKVEENPLLINHGKEHQIEIVYEDDHILIINKPPGLLSVPGKSINDSVQSRLKKLYPTSTIVHRLDQETSGLMVLSLSTKSLKSLQKQFINKLIQKKYIAILIGKVAQKKGVINLPLRGDYDDLPRQIVCDVHGKEAITEYEVLSVSGDQTRIALKPITGRSHQLRVHCAHAKGLGIAILGDTIYGVKDKRLFLHAKEIKLTHPISKIEMDFNSNPDF